MIKKHWQRTQRFIEHAGLALGVTLPLYIFETSLANWLKLTIIVSGYIILVPLILWLHKRYASTFVRVLCCDYEITARLVQRILNAQRIPFTKKSGLNQIVFQIRTGNILLEINDFMLNMPIDDHLKPQVATKLTLRPETAANATQMQYLRSMLDEAFALKGVA